ncbi:uncharacterized protein BBOV_IV010470 [Babesia bovis T2Bo]|uniref:Membrane protein, putative n=1 Tax=Babesia bovis TaxID=5865 RepID=A7AS81_BABBO|nr:uncharacterized protein BBOV_IV010470 [Babesia bovis T2Bo]EDO07400.1 putative integral membrane protein [Babesia bovis T2Bo]|eukprot:XP_001610968.1 hypothetical protein [Babesia bovis T2Bo]
MPLMSLWLGLLIPFIGSHITDAVKILPAAYQPWVTTGNSGVYPIADLICHAAGCTSRDTTTSNAVDPQCGSQTVCQSCPIPSLNSGDICYLSRLTPNEINVLEGHLDNVAATPVSASSDNGDEEERDSFLEVIPFDMPLKITTPESEIRTNSASCNSTSDGYIDLVVRVVVQWYRVPGRKMHEAAPIFDEEGHRAGMLMAGFDAAKDMISSRHDDGSFLEFKPNIMESFKKLNIFKKSDDEDIGGDDEGPMTDAEKRHVITRAGNFAYRQARKIFVNPTLHIHFSMNHRNITSCRQPQRWDGAVEDQSLVFTAVQNIRVKESDLKGSFFKEALKMHVNCEHCEVIEARSCVQVTCNKKIAPARRYDPGLYPTFAAGSVLRPSLPQTTGSTIGVHDPGALMSPIAMAAGAVQPAARPIANLRPHGHGIAHMPQGNALLPQHVAFTPVATLPPVANKPLVSGFIGNYTIIFSTLLLLLFTI